MEGVSVDVRFNRLDRELFEGDDSISRGLVFSFVGEGRTLMFTGSDSPLNQSDSLGDLLNRFTAPLRSSVLPFRKDHFSLLGEICGECSGDSWKAIFSDEGPPAEFEV